MGDTAPARAGCCSLLLLPLLGLWVAQVPVSAKPKHMTSAQWFEIQHVQPSPQGCKGEMDNINKHTKHCKGLNTFLHESCSSVAATCQTSVTACKNGHKSCHQSEEPVSLTQCELTSGKYPACRYKEKQLDALFIVVRDPPQQKDDLRYLLFPVPLDNVV
ncbi:ribonuclease 8-like [Molossus molossus]|uniref:ribonuclease 8-like n=1 Tax=Molossus molossus TaxID=27622 RepID=UPI001745E624|nr:ribonuclease 8-like [Molossus molossus]